MQFPSIIHHIVSNKCCKWYVDITGRRGYSGTTAKSKFHEKIKKDNKRNL